jgi:hypothetical protein
VSVKLRFLYTSFSNVGKACIERGKLTDVEAMIHYRQVP